MLDYKEEPGFFSKERVYSLKTNPGGFLVGRTAADFPVLQKSLERNFPFAHVPSFAKAQMYRRNRYFFER